MRWPFRSATSRRREAIAEPFPVDWRRLLASDWPAWHDLSRQEQAHVEDLVRGFLATIEVEPANGMDVEERMRVLIAAQAVLLLLGHSLAEGPLDALRRFGDVRTVVVHPTTVVLAGERPTRIPRVMSDAPMHLLGQAELYGPVLLAWDAVEHGLAPGAPGNVVLHEFAHKLDMRDGHVDGTPPAPDDASARRWFDVATRELANLRRFRDPVLRPYGAQNPAEFFAVATEAFFHQPVELAVHKPELYAALSGLYRQDPASRVVLQPM